MRSIKKIIVSLLLVLMLTSLCGCWNYRLLEDIAIVAGVAIDKGVEGRFELTIEIAETQRGKETNVKSRIIHLFGRTIFDAVRNGISITGKKLYWSHTKAIIISEQIARDEMMNVVDWLDRDAETRTDIELFVSKGMPAKEVLLVDNPTGKIVSYTLESIIQNENNLSKARRTQTWKFANDVLSPGICPRIPSVILWKDHDEVVPQVEGTALFQGSVFVGFIDGEDTQSLLFVQDNIEGGLLVFPLTYEENDLTVSLEIFKSKTKLTPIFTQDVPEINIDIETVVALDEVQGPLGQIDGDLIYALEDAAAAYLKQRIEMTIREVQNKYGCDTFGFGNLIYRKRPQKWKELEPDWDAIFPNLKVSISPKVTIKNSATQARP